MNWETFKQRLPVIPKDIVWHKTRYLDFMLRLKMMSDETFRRCFDPRFDLTDIFHEQLFDKVWGSIPGSFTIFIRGLVGVDTGLGTGKSTVGIELLRLYQPNASIENIGWSNDELLDKVQRLPLDDEDPDANHVMMRDETPESLRRRSNIEFETLKVAARIKKLSWILVKPEVESTGAVSFLLEPIYRTDDMRYVKLAVYVPGSNYIGSIVIHIELNNPLWLAYGPMKNKYIDSVVNRQTNDLKHKEIADEFMKTEMFNRCVIKGKPNKIRIAKYLRSFRPNFTREELRFIADSILEICESMTKEELESFTEPAPNPPQEPKEDNLSHQESPPEPKPIKPPKKGETLCPSCNQYTRTITEEGKKHCIICANIKEEHHDEIHHPDGTE